MSWFDTVERRKFIRQHKRDGRAGIAWGLFYLVGAAFWSAVAYAATLDHGRVDFAGPTMGPYAWTGFVVGVVLGFYMLKAGLSSIGAGLDHRQTARDAREDSRGRLWLVFVALVPTVVTMFSPRTASRREDGDLVASSVLRVPGV